MPVAMAIASMLALFALGGGLRSASAADSPITFEQARQILLEQVIKPGRLRRGDDLIAFALKRPLAVGDRVRPFQGLGRSARVATGPQWFFWVDDEPIAFFEHANRYVFVDARTGRVRVLRQRWWPRVNGRAPWGRFGDYWNRANWAFSTLEPLRRPSGRAAAAANPAAHPLRALQSECAIVVSGPSENGFHTDQAAADMARVLRGRLFGGTSRGPDAVRKLLGPSPAEFEETVDVFARAGCEDILIFITAHGVDRADGDGEVPMSAGARYRVSQLRRLLGRYPNVDFKVVVESCYSGRWVSGVRDVPNVHIAIASSGGDELSYAASPDGGTERAGDSNPDDRGGEYSSGLIEDLRDRPASRAEVAHLRDCLDAGRPFIVCALELAHNSALAKDVFAREGRTHPQIYMRSTVRPPEPEPPPPPTPLALRVSPSHTHPQPNEGFSFLCVNVTSELEAQFVSEASGPGGYADRIVIAPDAQRSTHTKTFTLTLRTPGDYTITTTATKNTRRQVDTQAYTVPPPPPDGAAQGPFPCPPRDA